MKWNAVCQVHPNMHTKLISILFAALEYSTKIPAVGYSTVVSDIYDNTVN